MPLLKPTESVEYSKTFAEAFSKLMEWIDTTTAAVSEHEKTEYYPGKQLSS